MATLADDKRRSYSVDDMFTELPMIGSDIIYENAAVGKVDASGHLRPLVGGDKFMGFAERQVDNSAGAAAAVNVRVLAIGQVELSVAGAVITDVDQPVYATDDDTFVMNPVGGSFIGNIIRFVSSGLVVVLFDAKNGVDPYANWPNREVYSASSTLDIQDTGKMFWVDTDAQTMTLLTYAAATAIEILVVNGGAFGTIEVIVDPAAGDLLSGPDDTGGDGGAATNTKATARRGDSLHVSTGGDDGYIVVPKGIWPIA